MLACIISHYSWVLLWQRENIQREKEGKFIGYHISGTILDISNIFIMYFLSRDRGNPPKKYRATSEGTYKVTEFLDRLPSKNKIQLEDRKYNKLEFLHA